MKATVGVDFHNLGAALLEGGYLITPIRPGAKSPLLPKWQSSPLTVDRLQNYDRRHGIGIICGVGEYPVVAVDIDTTDADLAEQCRDWCLTHLGFAPERIGKAPKTLLVYRAEKAGWRKSASAWFTDNDGVKHRCEVLGKGQQFVSHHVHPETGLPYTWIDWLGGIEHFAARELTIVTAEQIEQAIRTFETLAAERGLSRVEGSASAGKADDGMPVGLLTPPVGMTIEYAATLLGSIDASDYDAWIHAGMALHHEFSGSDDALALWDEWSREAGNYKDSDDLAKRWAGFTNDRSDSPLTARWLLKRAKDAQPDQFKRRANTEFGNADRLVDRYGSDLMHVPETGKWYAWNGRHWSRTTETTAKQMARDVVNDLPNDKPTEADNLEAYLKFCVASQKAVMIHNMISLAKADPKISASVTLLDANRHLLGTKNGAVDLRTGAFVAPDRQHRITITTACEYDQSAVAPLFEQTVSDAFFGDDEMIGFFQRLVGYALLGDPKESVIAIPYGNGCNGKSTIFGALQKVLGSYSVSISAESLMTSKQQTNGSQHRADLVPLNGSRFVLISESDEGSVLRESLVKTMTGGDVIIARAAHAPEPMEITPTWLAILPTNHRPTIKGDDHAIWRRILPIPFTRNFDTDALVTKDPDRAQKLAAEGPGILAWCVRGTLAYQKAGLRIPAGIRAARDAYRADMDLLAEWLETCCEVGPNYVATNADLWRSWKFFAEARGELQYVSTQRALGRRLVSKDFESIAFSYGIRGRGFKGLKIKHDEFGGS